MSAATSARRSVAPARVVGSIEVCCNSRANCLVVPVRRATEKRDGTWSGKTSESFNRAASGNMRLAIRSVATRTAVDVARMTTHHTTRAGNPCGAEINRDSAADAARATRIGVEKAIRRMPAAARG